MVQRISLIIKPKAHMTNRNLEATRQGLLADIDRRVADHILEPANRDLLRKLILKADSPEEAEQIAALGTTYKRTGFHFDKRLEKTDKAIHYFRRNEALSFRTDPAKPAHKLIIGDNFPALQNLLIEYRGRINVIYIDPPYGKDSMGEFARTNYENAISRDNLLSMLFPRLMLARELLAPDGVIFCSIDDRNQAYVKCLFDEVFGERNFLSCIVINRPSEIASNYVISKHEYALAFCKDSDKYTLRVNEKFTISRGTVGNENQTMPIIEFPAGLRCIGIPDGVYQSTRKIEESKENIENFTPIIVEDGKLYQPIKLKARWRSSNDMRNFFKNNCQPTKAKINGVITEIYFDNDRFNPQIKKQTYEKIPSLFLENKKGGTVLEKLNLTFDFPKSIELVTFLLDFAPKDALVLDFFAGSGTTGHAVLALNEKDGGRRQFILCQLNEKTETTPNGIAYDVTAKRLKRIMTGECYDGSRDFKWAQENLPYGGNLDVCEIGEVTDDAATEGKTPFDVIDETLYGLPRFATLREKVAWVCGNFAHTEKYLEDDAEWEQRQREADHATGE